ncbi:MAG: ATP-binding cassette domain-containing protein, partial [Desulfotomaculaceae bacterium]
MMLEIRDLNVFYNHQPVLQNFNLTLRQGETLSVIGESGAGKTTLGLSIMGLVKGKCTGQVLFNGANILDLPEKNRRSLRGNKLAMVFQNVEDALHPLYTAMDQVVESIMVHRKNNKAEAFSRARELFNSVGLKSDRTGDYPHQLSGGEKQRVLIAMALANDPAVVVLDEPTASLDALTKAEII